MGVPSFFKWLAKRYPHTVQSAAERPKGQGQGGSSSAAAAVGDGAPPGLPDTDASGMPLPVGANPALDNLYLDMNGIIHPCCHPEEGGSFTEEQMLARIWEYVQRIVSIARPRKLLYLAIDGVAPRAKMNQQRSRRFRAAREAAQKEEVHTKLKAEWLARGFKLPPHMRGENSGAEWDSNVITPGTPFMAKVSAALHFHVEWALQHEPAWRHLTVLFSDAKVPGEGEHKIINWIRAQRVADPQHYDPNTRHCLYGMDADLIMLGLATHERHFYIIRESLGDMVASAANVRCDFCGEKGHYSDKCVGEKWIQKAAAPPPPPGETHAAAVASGLDAAEAAARAQLIPETKTSGQAFQFLHLPILREYLSRELALPPQALASMPFPYDFENVLDDFILLCMFVGNDFLPHLPSLDIKEGAIEMLIRVYKDLLPTSLGGYLSTAGVVSLPRLQMMLEVLGGKENDILSRRRSKAAFHKRKDDEVRRRVHAIREDNARREREQNKMGVHVYEVDGTRKDEQAVVIQTTQGPVVFGGGGGNRNQTGGLPMPPPPPAPSSSSTSPAQLPMPLLNASSNSTSTGIKPFIHPSRQISAPSAGSAHMAQTGGSGPHPPPPTPNNNVEYDLDRLGPLVPVVAPKANLSAAALLREKLRAGKAGSAAPAAAAAAPAAAPAPVTTPAVAAAGPSVVGLGTMDESSVLADPPLVRLQSDPVHTSTVAMSAMSTAESSHVDDTAQKANLRAAQLLKQTLLGKRPRDAKPSGEGATVAEGAVAAPGSMDTAPTPAPEPVPAPAASPTLELPQKKARAESPAAAEEFKSTLAVPASSPNASSVLQASPSASPLSSSSSSEDATPAPAVSPSAFDPNETDQFGNPLSSHTFESFFEAKWQEMNEPKDIVDEVRFGEFGWKDRYYSVKLHFDLGKARADPSSPDAQVANRLFRTYIEGLCWVMQYYFHGPPSWGWFFPFHYAPLMEDLAVFLREGHMSSGAVFESGRPFEPVGQLMAVLPSRSNHCVPRVVQPLMSDDASSPLAAFYPRDFDLDLNGKKFLWQAVALLPFIDEALLLRELDRVRPGFTAEEKERNEKGVEYVFVRADSSTGRHIVRDVYERSLKDREGGVASVKRMDAAAVAALPQVPIDTAASRGLSGFLRPYAGASIPTLPSQLFSPEHPRPISSLEVVSAEYSLPPYRPHRCALLENAEPFQPLLQESDFLTLVAPRQYQPRNNYQNKNYNNQQQQQQGNGYGQQQQQQNRGPYQSAAVAYQSNLVAPLLPDVAAIPWHQPGAPVPVAASHYAQPPPPPQQQQGYFPQAPMMGYGAYGAQTAYAPPPQMMYGPPQQGGYYSLPHVQQGYFPQQTAYGAGPAVPGFPLPPPAAAAPAFNPALQAFLAQPPPPGKPAGYVPPMMHAIVPGFPLATPPPPPPPGAL